MHFLPSSIINKQGGAPKGTSRGVSRSKHQEVLQCTIMCLGEPCMSSFQRGAHNCKCNFSQQNNPFKKGE